MDIYLIETKKMKMKNKSKQFKDACSIGDIDCAFDVLERIWDKADRDEYRYRDYPDDILYDLMIHDGLSIALQHGHFNIIEMTLKEGHMIRHASKTFHHLFQLAYRMKQTVQTVPIELDNLISNMEQKLIAFLGTSNIRFHFWNESCFCEEHVKVELLYHAFVFQREQLFAALISKYFTCKHGTDRQKHLLQILFYTACQQGDLEHVRTLYNVLMINKISDDDYDKMMREALNRSLKEWHKPVMIQLLGWWTGEKSVAALQSRFAVEKRITCLQWLKRICPFLVVTADMLKDRNSNVLKQLVQWCDDDVRTTFVPSQYNVKTMHHVREIEEMETIFPQYHFKPGMRFA